MLRILSFVLLMAAMSVSQASTTLRIATLAPDGTNWMQLMRQAATDIQQQTDNRVRIRYFPGGVQGSDNTVLRKMQIRQLQGGAVAAGALVNIANATQLYSLPFTFRDLDEVRAIRDEFDPYIIDALAEKGFVVLGMSEGGFAYLMSNKPLRTSEDVRSQKVWVPEGDIIGQTIFTNGQVQPIPLPISDVYTSLQTGLIDTVAVNPSSAIALQWHTRLTHATDFPLVFLFGMMVVDQRAFNQVSAEDQAIVKTIMRDTFKAMDRQNEVDEAGAREALLQNGISFVELSEADQAAWYELAEGAVSDLADRDIYPVGLYQQLQQRLIEHRTNATASDE